MTYSPKYIVDVSRHQGEIDFVKMKAAGVAGVIIRAGFGRIEDSQYQRNYTLATAVDLPLGVYYAFNPAVDAYLQAQHFADLISGRIFNLRKHVPQVQVSYWHDIELNPGGYVQKAVAARVRSYTADWREMTQKDSGVYTAAWFWNRHIGAEEAEYFARFPLWVARYPWAENPPLELDNDLHPWNDEPQKLKLPPWDDFVLWQWSADENRRGAEFGAQSAAIDIDAYKVDEAPPPEPDPEPPPPVEIDYPRLGVVTDAVYLRTYISLQSRWIPGNGIIRTMQPGESLAIYDVALGLFGYDWYLVVDPFGNAGWCAQKFVREA